MISDASPRPAPTARLTLLPILLTALAVAMPQPVAAAGGSPSPTVTTLASAAEPAAEGQPVSLTAVVSGPGPASGTVTFTDDQLGPLQSASLDGGRAVATVPALPSGLHVLTADYGGDGAFASSSARLTLRVGGQVPSTAFVSSDRNPSPAGQPVTISAGVGIPAGQGMATGTVTINDGPATLGTVPVATLASPSGSGSPADQVSISPTLAPGVHSITATYSGDSNLSGSTSTVWTQVVGERMATSTTVVSNVNPVVSAQTATLTAAVATSTPTSLQPSGAMTFRDGEAVLGTAPLTSGGASLPVSLLGAGTHSVTASYTGDGDFQESSSARVALEVLEVSGGPAASVTTLGSDSNPAVFGQPATLRASVNAASGTGVPSGSVYFLDGSGALLGSKELDSGGRVSLPTTDLPAGPHRVKAMYSGDAGFAHSTSDLLDFSVVRATPAISAQGPGQGTTLAATVAARGSGRAPSGSVTFQDQAGVLGTAPLGSDGRASLTVPGLATGEHRVVALYNGDASYGSASTAFAQVVGGPLPTRTTVIASRSRLLWAGGASVSAKVTIGEPGNADPPTGTVTFRSGDTVLGVDQLDGQGVAQLTLPPLCPGSSSLVASFAGDGAFAPSAGTVTVEVLSPSQA